MEDQKDSCFSTLRTHIIRVKPGPSLGDRIAIYNRDGRLELGGVVPALGLIA